MESDEGCEGMGSMGRGGRGCINLSAGDLALFEFLPPSQRLVLFAGGGFVARPAGFGGHGRGRPGYLLASCWGRFSR